MESASIKRPVGLMTPALFECLGYWTGGPFIRAVGLRPSVPLWPAGET